MNNLTQESLLKMSNNQLAHIITNILENLCYQSNPNLEAVEPFIKLIYTTMKELGKRNTEHIVIFKLQKILNRLLAEFPSSYRVIPMEKFEEDLIALLEETDFEKSSLKELKKIFIESNKNKSYINIPLIYSVMATLSQMQRNRYEVYKQILTIYNNSKKGINFVPAHNEEISSKQYRSFIDSSIKSMK